MISPTATEVRVAHRKVVRSAVAWVNDFVSDPENLPGDKFDNDLIHQVMDYKDLTGEFHESVNQVDSQQPQTVGAETTGSFSAGGESGTGTGAPQSTSESSPPTFKVGDKVRRILSCNPEHRRQTIHPGDEAVVTVVHENGWIGFDIYPTRNDPRYFELVEPAPKFKVGDKVRRKFQSPAGSFDMDKTYVVSSVERGHSYYLTFEGTKYPCGPLSTLGWDEKFFELAEEEPKFKKGDKVRCLRDFKSLYYEQHKGDVYTVLSYRDPDGLYSSGSLQLEEFPMLRYNGYAFWAAQDFELVKENPKFNKGDRVRTIDGLYKGAEGVVAGYWKDKVVVSHPDNVGHWESRVYGDLGYVPYAAIWRENWLELVEEEKPLAYTKYDLLIFDWLFPPGVRPSEVRVQR